MGTPQHIYGVFLPDGRWGMTRNKREAIKNAKKHGGEVRSIQAAGAERYWDSPTFRITSDHVWPTNRNPIGGNDLVRALEEKGFYGTLDRWKQGKISEEQALGELEGTIKPVVKISKPPDPYTAAARMKMGGVKRAESWSRWVQLTALRPGMDAKDWYKIYDSV